jgi:hypothetical protein
MRKSLLASVAVSALIAGSVAAQADIVRPFSGVGGFGFLGPGAGQEIWRYGSSTPIPPPSGTDVGWGSPGVGHGGNASFEAVPVNDFEITFTSALDPAQIAIPGAGCSGGTSGGTVFCTSSGVLWSPVFDPSSPDSIAFFAPAGTELDPGQSYFVNIMLLAGDGVFGEAFTGAWTSEVPEPASMTLVGAGIGTWPLPTSSRPGGRIPTTPSSGLFGLVMMRRRKLGRITSPHALA